MPNWIWRPGFEELITPKVEPWKKLGLPRIGVLVTLMNCAMASRFALSPSEKRLERFMSAVANPGPRNEPIPQVPKCPACPGMAGVGFQNWGPDCASPSEAIARRPPRGTPERESARGEL